MLCLPEITRINGEVILLFKRDVFGDFYALNNKIVNVTHDKGVSHLFHTNKKYNKNNGL